MAAERLAVVAIGGNSLIKHRDRQSVADQYQAICETSQHLAGLVQQGFQLVITHGNGPQVGFIMLRSEIARRRLGLHIVPLSSCVADTQGAIGLQIQQALANTLARLGLEPKVATLVTQVEVAADDPGFGDPVKPVGEFYRQEQLAELARQHPDWVLKKDADRGFRRVVASPAPVRIVEQEAVDSLLAAGFHVVVAGGGGVPVVRSAGGLQSVDAVIDKDRTAALLARNLGASLLIISTAVARVALNYGGPDEQPLGRERVAAMEQYLRQGHFAAGSMAPKIEAAIRFIRAGGGRVIITCPENIDQAVVHDGGTQIVP